MEKNTKKHNLKLFLSTFTSVFLLVFGLAILAVTFFPVLASSLTPKIDYKPQLSIDSGTNTKSAVIGNVPIRQLYPPLVEIEKREPGNWIRIPSIGVDVPIKMSPSLEDADVINTLNSGAALYPNGVLPGRLGNAFISAHSTGEPWKGRYRFAFLKINDLKPGNLMHIDYEGVRFTYKITESEIIKPDPNTRIKSDKAMPTITLMACWPLWSTSQRMLIHGELTNITKLTIQPKTS